MNRHGREDPPAPPGPGDEDSERGDRKSRGRPRRRRHPAGLSVRLLLAAGLLIGVAPLVASAYPGNQASPTEVEAGAAGTDPQKTAEQKLAGGVPSPLPGSLHQDDFRRAVWLIDDLSLYFEELGRLEMNQHARRLWLMLRDHYADVAERITLMLTGGRIAVTDLVPGRDGATLDDRILVDATLDGDWNPEAVLEARRLGGDDWRFIGRLASVLVQRLGDTPGAREGSPWMREHLRRSGLRRLLQAEGWPERMTSFTRLAFLKDRYLLASLLSSAAATAELRTIWGVRRRQLEAEVQDFIGRRALGFSGEAATALATDWREYAASAHRLGRPWAGAVLRPAAPLAERPSDRLQQRFALAPHSEAETAAAPRLDSPAGRLKELPAPVAQPEGEPAAAGARLSDLRALEIEKKLGGQAAAPPGLGQIPDWGPKRLSDIAAKDVEAPRMDGLGRVAMEAPEKSLRHDGPEPPAPYRIAAAPLAGDSPLAADLAPGPAAGAPPPEQPAARRLALAPLAGETLGPLQRAPAAGLVYADPELPEDWSALETAPKPVQTAAAEAAQAPAETAGPQPEPAPVSDAGATAPAPPPGGSIVVEASDARLILTFLGLIAVILTLLLAVLLLRRGGKEPTKAPAEALPQPQDKEREMPTDSPLYAEAAAPGEDLVSEPEAETATIFVPPAPEDAPTAEPPHHCPETAEPQRNGAAAPPPPPKAGAAADDRGAPRHIDRAPGPRPAAGGRPRVAQIKAVQPPLDPSVLPQQLIVALRASRLGEFEILLRELAGLPASRVKRILESAGGEDLVPLCRALDMEDLRFASLYLLVRKHYHGEPEPTSERLAKALALYEQIDPDLARQVLARWQADEAAPGLVDAAKAAGQETLAPAH